MDNSEGGGSTRCLGGGVCPVMGVVLIIPWKPMDCMGRIIPVTRKRIGMFDFIIAFGKEVMTRNVMIDKNEYKQWRRWKGRGVLMGAFVCVNVSLHFT